MNDFLGLIAELAIGFTGFAAIASVLGRSPTQADLRLDRLRLRNLVEVGVFTVVMALLPQVLETGESERSGVWMVSCAVMLVGLAFMAFVHIGRNRSADVGSLEGYSLVASVTVYGIAAVGVVVLVLGLALPSLSPARAYLVSLFLWVVMLGVYFVRIAASLLPHRFMDRE